MPRFFKHIIGIMLVILIAGCAGGGCSSGCAGCGMTPLPGGFEPKARIENAGSVRLTDSGLAFLEANLAPLAKQLLGANGGNGGVITFPIPTTSGSTAGIKYDVCPGGPDANANPPKCVAEIDIGNAKLAIDTSNPHDIHITGPLPIRLQNLPIDIVYLFIPDSTEARLTGNGCTKPPTYADIPLDVDISIEVDTDMSHSRYGYSRVKINKLDVDQNKLQSSFNFCGGGFSGTVLGIMKPLIFNLLVGNLIGTLSDTINQQLCQQSNPMVNPPCPLGSNDVSGVCRYGTDANAECVPIVLGTDGHIDLSGALASISPGTTGGLDILFAVGGPSKRPDSSGFAWGDLNPVGAGATLGMYGGGEPSPLSGCVKFSDMALPANIPIPSELMTNDPPTLSDPNAPQWPQGLAGPHIGIALAERYANYALNSVYNSGTLCLALTTETVPQLSSGTLSLLASSLKDLGLQREAQQVALVIRPGKPPTVTFGNGANLEKDPSLRVKLDQASFDFYIWSTDRFIRFMTATFDLDVPVNLAVTPNGLLPVLDKIGVTNGKVTNSELLREDPATIAAALQGLLGGLAGQFLGGINPIDISGALASTGLTLTIPESIDGQGSPGLRKLTKDTDNYLGIFATLGIAGQPFKANTTTLWVVNKTVEFEGFRIPTITTENAPEVNIQMSSVLDDGTQTVEYSYRVDQGAWRPFTRERMVTVRDEWLRLQGKHTISARSRVVGHPESMDETPATIDVVIDAEPPVITIAEPVGTVAAVDVRDIVSGGTEPQVRYRLDEGAWSDWKLASEITSIDVGEAADLTVEAQDSEGNVATASQALIRGRGIPTGAGCGCTVVGEETSSNNAAWFLALGMVGAALRLARRRADKPAEDKPSNPKMRATSKLNGRRALRGLTGIAMLGALGSIVGCGDDTAVVKVDTYTCQPPNCTTLNPGLIGAYNSVAVSGRAIWVAGYAEADWSNDYTWGDLAVGQWDGKAVNWSAVDGVPNDNPVDPNSYNKNGWRGGQVDPGDDVGLWTSIALDEAGRPAVAYYDRTNRALKFAQKIETTWNIMTVESKAQSDIGRYAKLLIVKGVPTIAYLSIEPGKDGAISSKVRIATATSATPGATDWTFEDAVVDNATPCRSYMCATGAACVVSTNTCVMKQTSCMPSCGSGTACVDVGMGATCSAIRDSSKLDTYPDAVGDYISLGITSKGELGLAYYDRIRGNLMIASKSGGMWKSMIVDGASPDGMTDTGDKGIGASLFIDEKDDWHISYVDGLSEGVRYAHVASDMTIKLTTVVDDGLTLGGVKFDDGQHIVGDDSSIYVGPSGEIHITYQDATVGTLRHAIGTPSGDMVSWKVTAIDQTGFAGAFSHPFISDSKLMLANWWRIGGAEVKGDVNIITP